MLIHWFLPSHPDILTSWHPFSIHLKIIMNKPKHSHATFLLSAVALEQLPQDEGIEIAFIGHSNAGKSSALNAISGVKGLARISKTPGRTQAINLFAIDEHRRFVDLPGYGYAKVPANIKQRWQETINRYLQKRRCLRGLILIMDIRHPLKELDRKLLEWAEQCKLPVHILLSKADKLSRSQALHTLHKIEHEIKDYTKVTVQCFSSLTHSGLEDVLLQLDEWLTAAED